MCLVETRAHVGGGGGGSAVTGAHLNSGNAHADARIITKLTKTGKARAAGAHARSSAAVTSSAVNGRKASEPWCAAAVRAMLAGSDGSRELKCRF